MRNFNQKYLLGFLMCLFFAISINAQEKTMVKGLVTNSKGEPIKNVSIILKETSQGTTSNESGKFEFSTEVEGVKTIIASFVGYQQAIKNITLIKGKITTVNLKLKEGEELDEVVVSGKKRYFKNVVLESKTAMKSNLKLLNTPAAIVSVDKSILEDQSITSMQGAIRNISGVTQAGNNYGIGDNLIIRGLGVNYAYDGMYAGAGLGNNYNPVRTMTNIDKIEVLKGPATGLYGIGSAGGVFNMIEKKPLDFQQISASFSAGNWNYFRGMVDASIPLSDKTAFRIVGAKEYTDGYRDVKKDVNEVHASFRYNITDNSRFILSSSYINDENQVESVGYPVRIFNRESLTNPNATNITWEDLINDPKGVGVILTENQRKDLANSLEGNIGLQPFNLNGGNLISPLSTPNKGEEFRVKLRNDWDITRRSSLTQQLMYRTYSSDFTRQTGAYNYVYWKRRGVINANPRAPLMLNGVLYPFAARRQEYRHQESKETSLQYFADFTNKWSLSDNFKGEHLVSYNFERRDMNLKSWSIYDKDGGGIVPYILDIRNPNWGTGTFWDYNPQLRTNYEKNLENIGVGLQEVLTIYNRLTARIGGAFSRVKQIYTQKGTARNKNTATLPADTDDSGFTYNLGLNYEVIDNLATFVNYSQGRTAYSITGSVNGKNDRPDSESTSFDVGLRYAFKGEDSKLNASVVCFDTRRTNLRRNNPIYNDNVGDSEYNVSVPQYFYDDEDKTEGVEVDVNFAINKNWSLSGNGTYQDAITIRGGKKSVQLKGVPKRFMRVWGEYRLFLSNLDNPVRFNLGYQYTDERSINSSAFGLPEAFIPEYSIWDAGVSYRYKKWDLRCVVDNLLNEKYYSSALFLGGLPGKTRNFKVTLKYLF